MTAPAQTGFIAEEDPRHPGWLTWRLADSSRFNGQVMGDMFRARARHFGSSLDSALFGDNMPSAVYRTLVAETHKGLPTLHRYLRLRKRVLGITDDLRYYDNSPPLFPLAPAPVFSVADAKRRLDKPPRAGRPVVRAP